MALGGCSVLVEYLPSLAPVGPPAVVLYTPTMKSPARDDDGDRWWGPLSLGCSA